VPFQQLHLSLNGLDPETVEAACFETGAWSVTLSDAADHPILEPLPGTAPLWPSVALSALYDAATDTAEVATTLRARLGQPTLSITFVPIEDRVWEREWLRDFKPMRFGARLWVCPGGQPPTHDADRAIVVWLDPGLAFGTGTHATTALCLSWLDSSHLEGAKVLDVGTGSGILAIAALKLGAARAHALDIDPQALIATRDNANRNAIGDSLTIADAEAPWGDRYDLVLANILAEPLIALAPRIAAVTRSGGSIVLSGLLAEQAEAVAEAYRPWFEVAAPRFRDGWAALDARRRV
jgi:ribosomal protein L11 methyltransferase